MRTPLLKYWTQVQPMRTPPLKYWTQVTSVGEYYVVRIDEVQRDKVYE